MTELDWHDRAQFDAELNSCGKYQDFSSGLSIVV